jgi:hypothetical protein
MDKQPAECPQWVESGHCACQRQFNMATDLQDALRQLQGASPAAPSADAAALIQRLESRYGVRLPQDFRWYLTRSSGFDGWEDYGGIGWYPIQRIKSLPEVAGDELAGATSEVAEEAEQYLIFADFLDWCGYGYALCCSDGARRGHVAMVHPAPGRFICRTFTTFVQLAAADSNRLHSPVGDHYVDIP